MGEKKRSEPSRTCGLIKQWIVGGQAEQSARKSGEAERKRGVLVAAQQRRALSLQRMIIRPPGTSGLPRGTEAVAAATVISRRFYLRAQLANIIP